MITTGGVILMSSSSSLYATTDVMALSSTISNIIQSKYPIIFEQSFQTLTSSSLSWIDKQFDNELEFVRIDNTTTKPTTEIAATTVCTHQVDIEEDPGNNNHEEEEQQQQRNITIAKVLIRRIVYKCLDKYSTISSRVEVEEALKYYALPQDLQDDLFSDMEARLNLKHGMMQFINYKITVNAFRNNDDLDDNNHNYNGSNYYKAILWENILTHPITSYVPVQCQSCGYIIPDEYNNTDGDTDANIGLTEVAPTFEEQPFVRTGWFRGPRLQPKVFQLNCPKCEHVSRWYRSRSPQIILNPNRWGRLCGEQEDLKLDLANYLSIGIRTVLPLDWDHIWKSWHLRKDKDEERNFVLRLDEGIGSFTRIFAICPTPNECGDITDLYFLKACRHSLSPNKDHNQANEDDDNNNNNNNNSNNKVEEEKSMNRYYQIIDEARRDNTGSKTQSNTVNGYAIHRSKLTATEVSKEYKML
ncbi:hypothetical protein FRACYDRAFT_246262 [Fragilariopsis cylindrus CCMP1102]|uniref:Uncharacterized protein n=1 Tax=Fragilariopsis cylindrus CCMP1102 TaxID=635003 RepID=A0A1E7EYV3_9STRA|nr:hypothetical protein FRACYDRAFT_246262 [Fragilariopsis cylindrus CCMP1102]|eukprot:OEU11151.1 hypothetical protein FRACYDRAFT_246262 [Fragilariopsis cylindrus CCMP1102]